LWKYLRHNFNNHIKNNNDDDDDDYDNNNNDDDDNDNNNIINNSKQYNSLLNEFVETHNVIFQQKSKEYKDEYILRREAHAFNKAFTYIESLSDAKTLLMKYGDKDLYEIFLKFVAAKFIEQTRYGSQIHQNNACFVYMGLPIVKLDSIYRGMMNDADVYKFKPLMDVAEYELLESLLFQKPFGDNIYFGWKKLAFQMGLI
jgi:hypothetical protein